MTPPTTNAASTDTADTIESTVTERFHPDPGSEPTGETPRQDTATDVTGIAEAPADLADEQSPDHNFTFTRLLAFGVLPAFALVLALGAGYLKWIDTTARNDEVARTQSVRAATEATISMLSYRPDTAEKDLVAARDLMTGAFRDSYTSLTDNTVIPGAEQRQISAVASVPAAAPVSASDTHAVVLLFVNQTTVIGDSAPTDTASTVRVTLDKVGGRWLISQFEPT